MLLKNHGIIYVALRNMKYINLSVAPLLLPTTTIYTTTKYGANLPSTIEINQICLQFSKQKGGRKREETLHSTEENKKEYYIYNIAVVR